jgi:hypothetical protein
MGYRLRSGEGAADGVRRIARGQIDFAADQLDGKGDGDLDSAVHESRKAFKRLRALVRVSRDALGDEAYRRENTIFRDAGRRLSAARDAAVLVETLEDLTARYRTELADDAFSGLRDALADEAAAASARLADDRGSVEGCRARSRPPGAASPAGRSTTTVASSYSSPASSASTVAGGGR